jgi:hypothetical protein
VAADPEREITLKMIGGHHPSLWICRYAWLGTVDCGDEGWTTLCDKLSSFCVLLLYEAEALLIEQSLV